ncbi:MAG: hypothetical protein LBH19_08755 [Dysgonamonadaceae bacterium]|jgi:hypothetical protein|nr:hypothetical protein [Dysgonamonadaceae bacterium]
MKKYILILILYSLGVSVYSQKSSNRATETLTNVYEQAKQTRKNSNRAAAIKKDLDKQAEQTNKCIEQAVEQAKRMIHSSTIHSADEYIYVLYAGGRKIAEFSSQRECDDQVNNFKRLVENGIKQCISDRQAQIAVIRKAYNSLNLVGKKEKNFNYKSGNISGLYNPAGYNISDTDEKSASNLSGRIFTPSSDNKTPQKELSSLLVSDPKDRKAFDGSDLSVSTNTVSFRPQVNTSGIAYGSIPKFNEKPVAFPDTKIPLAVTVRNMPKTDVIEEVKHEHPYIELTAGTIKSVGNLAVSTGAGLLLIPTVNIWKENIKAWQDFRQDGKITSTKEIFYNAFWDDGKVPAEILGSAVGAGVIKKGSRTLMNRTVRNGMEPFAAFEFAGKVEDGLRSTYTGLEAGKAWGKQLAEDYTKSQAGTK